MKTPDLLSHTTTPIEIAEAVTKAKASIKQQNDTSVFSITRQLELVDELAAFDLGAFLLTHKGVNGYWTDYFLTHPWNGRKTGLNNRGEKFSQLESFILERAPTLLATQQRFQIFLEQNQLAVRNNAKLLSLPCGLMGELLYLNYENIENLDLFGIDLDPEALSLAQQNAKSKNLDKWCQLIKKDAWRLDYENKFDLISSNGLTIYESSDEKVAKLYKLFFKALKPGGKLITSFMTPPPTATDNCEWDMSQVIPADLMLQKVLFVDIVQAAFSCFRSTATTKKQLQQAGFKNIGFIYDKARMFPTVVVVKE